MNLKQAHQKSMIESAGADQVFPSDVFLAVLINPATYHVELTGGMRQIPTGVGGDRDVHEGLLAHGAMASKSHHHSILWHTKLKAILLWYDFLLKMTLILKKQINSHF
jgi:hypothetical protein